MSHFQFWSWSSAQLHWIPATAEGASGRFLALGAEAAYGRGHPKRAGVSSATFPPLLRPLIWTDFFTRVAAARSRRHRLHAR